MEQEELFLDYDNWFVCYDCGNEHVPYENEIVEVLLCPICKEERLCDFDDDNDPIIVYGE